MKLFINTKGTDPGGTYTYIKETTIAAMLIGNIYNQARSFIHLACATARGNLIGESGSLF